MFHRNPIVIALAGWLAAGAFVGTASAQDAVLVNAIGTNPPHFNRLLTTEIGTMVVGGTMYETLVRLDADFTPMPSLATEWESNKEATEYRFTLREGVRWHDGEPFTSADVEFTFENYLPLAPQSSAFAKFVEDVSAPDEQTVVVKFNSPYAPFVEALAGLWIVPEHVFGDGQDVATHPANSNPVGTGPFKFESFQSGDRAVVVRNDDYWGEKPGVSRIVFPVIPDANSRILALESGDIHYLYGSYVDKSSYGRLLKDDRFVAMPNLGGVSTVTAHLNTRSGPLAEYEVRKAIYQALDRETIAERAYYGYATPTRGPIPADMTWAVSDAVDFNRDLPHDPEAAKKLLDEAGFPAGDGGTRFSIDLTYPSEYSTLASAAGVIQSNLAEVGIDVNLVGEDFQVWTQRTYKANDYDISIVFYTTFEDPSLGVTRAYICNPDKIVYRNASGLCDEELDAAFLAAGQTTDRAERLAAFTKAEKRVAELLHTYPIVVEQQFNFGRQDLWQLEEAHSTHPVNWSLVKPQD